MPAAQAAGDFLGEKVEAFFARRGGYKGAPDFPTPIIADEIKAPAFAPALDTTRLRATIWGTRGSTPTPGARFLRHGGNTSCMSVVLGDEQFIFDAGSGIRELSRLRKRYGRGRWRKRKGFAEIRLPSGEILRAELHWYEATGIGKREIKIKAFI